MEEEEMSRNGDEDFPRPETEDAEVPVDDGKTAREPVKRTTTRLKEREVAGFEGSDGPGEQGGGGGKETPPEGGIRVDVKKPFKPFVRVRRMVMPGRCYYHPGLGASYLCSGCGKSLCAACSNWHSGMYFCPVCQPRAPVQETPAEKPVNWAPAAVILGIFLIILGSALAVGYWPSTSVSAAEFDQHMDAYTHGGSHNFEDYNPGDTVTIKDEIVRVTTDYDPQYGVVTRFWFDSMGEDDGDRPYWAMFDGDLARDYGDGDSIVMTLHITEDGRTRDEVVRELNGNLPNSSNIAHTTGTDFMFFFIICIGGLLIALFLLNRFGYLGQRDTGERQPEES